MLREMTERARGSLKKEVKMVRLQIGQERKGDQELDKGNDMFKRLEVPMK